MIETEHWTALPSPNLLVESSAEDVAHLLAALAGKGGKDSRGVFFLIRETGEQAQNAMGLNRSPSSG